MKSANSGEFGLRIVFLCILWHEREAKPRMLEQRNGKPEKSAPEESLRQRTQNARSEKSARGLEMSEESRCQRTRPPEKSLPLWTEESTSPLPEESLPLCPEESLSASQRSPFPLPRGVTFPSARGVSSPLPEKSFPSAREVVAPLTREVAFPLPEAMPEESISPLNREIVRSAGESSDFRQRGDNLQSKPAGLTFLYTILFLLESGFAWQLPW